MDSLKKNDKKEKKVTIKARSENIFIPSVQWNGDSTPRSLASMTSMDSMSRHSVKSAQNNAPTIKMGANGNIVIGLRSSDLGLPEKLQALNMDRYRIISPLRNRIDNKDLSSQPANFLSNSDDSIASYSTPIHFASGAMSVSLGLDNEYIDSSAQLLNSGILWGDTSINMYERELQCEKKKRDDILAEMARLQKLKEDEERKAKEKVIIDKRLMARVVSLLFSRHFNFDHDFRNSAVLKNPAVSVDLTIPHSSFGNIGENLIGSRPSTAKSLATSNSVIEDSPQTKMNIDVPPFRPQSPPSRPRTQENLESIHSIASIGSSPGQSQVTESQKSTPTKAGFSKIREKLMNLSKFVVGHSNRKVMLNWHVLEARFSKSVYLKTEMVRDSSGLVHPVKHAALPLSTLLGILCSPKVRIGFNELPGILQKFDFPASEVVRARKIAAVKAILGPNNGEGIKQAMALKLELQKLTQEDEILVTLEEIRGVIFSQDPTERALEIERLEKEKDRVMSALIEEKKKKDEIKEKAEARKKKMMDDFMDCLRMIQFPRGALTVYRHSLLSSLFVYCQKAVAAYHAERDVTVSEEIVTLLGIDAFPSFIRQSLALSVKKKRKADQDMSQLKQDTASLEDDGEDERADQVPTPNVAPDAMGLTSPSQPRRKLTRTGSFLSKKSFMAQGGGIKAALATIGFNGNFRLKIHGPPTFLNLLLETVSYGKGLNGLAYRDVVEMLQAYCATRIQGIVRGFLKRWRFQAARRKWRILFLEHKRKNFMAWATLTRHNFDTRRFCWRRLTKWRYYTRRLKVKRELFRLCYWPFFVWRRWSTRCAVAKEKSKFLVSRVMPTILEMKIFRAWKTWSQGELHIKNRAIMYFKGLQKKALRKSLRWFHRWTVRRKAIRKAWFKGGSSMYSKHLFLIKNTPFLLWKSLLFYKKLVRERVMHYAQDFHHWLYPQLEFIAPPNRTDRRKLLEAKRIEAQTAVEEMSSASLKKSKKDRKKRSDSQSSFHSQNSELPSGSIGSSTGPSLSTTRSSRVLAREESGSTLSKMKKKYRPDAQAVARLQAVFTSTRPGFPWKSDIRRQRLDFEVYSDGEEEDEEGYFPFPSTMESIYEVNVKSLHPLLSPEDVPFLQVTKPFVLETAAVLARKYLLVEKWSLFEKAMRFHRVAKRAWQNWRIFSHVRRNARQARKKYQNQKKRLVFDALLGWMHRDPRYVKEEVILTQADNLGNAVRNFRLEKMARRRQAAVDIKEIFGQDYDMIPRTTLSSISSMDPARTTASSPSIEGLTLMDPSRKVEGNEALMVNEPLAGATLGEMSPLVVNPSTPALAPLPAPVGTLDSIHPSSSPVLSIDTQPVDNSLQILPSETSALRPSTQENPTQSSLSSSSSSSSELTLAERRAMYRRPDLLQWDRQDRDQDLKLAEEMMQICHVYRQEASLMAVEADAQALEFKKERAEKVRILRDIFSSEDRITDDALALEMDYVDKFKIHAAQILVNVIYKIYLEVQTALSKEEAKKYFRAMRLPMLLKRGAIMLNRKRMVNWLRICRRLILIDRNAQFYRKKRILWVTYNRWLKFMELETLSATPGLIRIIRRRKTLFPSFSQELYAKGFRKIVYHNNHRLEIACAGFRTVFYRWKMATQEAKIFQLLETLAKKKHRLRTLSLCFGALRYGMRPRDWMKTRRQDPIFALVRIETDMDQIAKRFLSMRRHGLAQVIRRYNRKFDFYQKKEGRKSMSFGRFLRNFSWEVSRRLVTEQRILFEAFEKRGSQEFVDVTAPAPGHSLIPSIMTTVEGRTFFDPSPHLLPDAYLKPATPVSSYLAQPVATLSSSNINLSSTAALMLNRLPGGFQLRKLRLNFQDHQGIVGWQVVWAGDATKEVEGPKRGKWAGAAMHVEELIVPKDEFVVGVEYLYEGAAIMGLRFRLFREGWSKWAGGKTSMSTLSVYYGLELAPSVPQEEEFEARLDDDDDPAYPNIYVIGFSGMQTHGRSTNLGLVIRKVKTQHIFSYYWVQDALDRNKAAGNSLEALNGVAGGEASVIMNATEVPSEVLLGGAMSLSQEGLTLASQGNKNDGDLHAHVQMTTNSADLSNSVDSAHQELYLNPEQDLEQGEYFDGSEAGSEESKEDEDGEKEDGEGSPEELAAKKRMQMLNGRAALTSSEEQFFDVVRMRTTEVKVAQIRVERFARRIWTQRDIRVDPVLSKLTPLRIVAGLSRWLFEALCKKLLGLFVTEKHGTELVSKAHLLSLKAEIVERRATGVSMNLRALEGEVQPWAGKSLLGPQERLAKKEYLEKVLSFKDEIRMLMEESKRIREKSMEYEKEGRSMLPRMKLTRFVYGNYRLKVSAARNKESLLERMSIDDIKNALCGTSVRDTSLSESTMQTIRYSIKSRPRTIQFDGSLDELVEQEVYKHRERERHQAMIEDRNCFYFGGSQASSKRSSRGQSRITTLSGLDQSSSRSLQSLDDEDSLLASTPNSRQNSLRASATTSALLRKSSPLVLPSMKKSSSHSTYKKK